MIKSKIIAAAWLIALASCYAACGTLDQSVNLQTRAGGTFYVEAVLAEHVPVNMLVDTGASMLTINAKTFKLLDQYHTMDYSHDLGFRTASGNIHKVKVYKLSKLQLSKSCVLENIDVAVIKKGNNILGMNVLSHFAPFGLNLHPPTLNLSNCQDVDPLLAKQ